MPNVFSVDATLAQLLDAIGDGGAAGTTAGEGAPGTPTIPPAARDAHETPWPALGLLGAWVSPRNGWACGIAAAAALSFRFASECAVLSASARRLSALSSSFFGGDAFVSCGSAEAACCEGACPSG